MIHSEFCGDSQCNYSVDTGFTSEWLQYFALLLIFFIDVLPYALYLRVWNRTASFRYFFVTMSICLISNAQSLCN